MQAVNPFKQRHAVHEDISRFLTKSTENLPQATVDAHPVQQNFDNDMGEPKRKAYIARQARN